MAQLIEESLLQAIKKDDTKAFNALMEKAQCGAYRLGRFPVLSLLYLYKSRGILSEHEEKFLKITEFELLREPAELSNKFSHKAGKCLRLYFNELVSPLEMLLVLDRIKHLKRIYPLTKPSSEIKKRLQSIYNIKYSLAVKFEGNEIIIDRRPLSYREKKNIATVCLSSVLAVAVVVAVPVTTVSLMPEQVEGEVKKLSQINFGSQEEYTLKRDIVLPENYSVDKINCTINGEGNKLILSKGATLGELNGKISDLIIQSNGEAIFTSVSEKGSIESVTVDVVADVTATESTALVALTNYGTLDGVTVNISGNVTALAVSEQTAEEFYVGGLVLNNYNKSGTNKNYFGTIKNCTVNYSQFTLAGEASANATFGGVAGINEGYVQDCKVTGEISADTFDLAGVCAVNNGLLSGNVNEADLSQSSTDEGWNPIACGIVLNNSYAVEYCKNTGTVSAVSGTQAEELTVTAAGIAAISYGEIFYSVNEGNISAISGGVAYAGGIASRSCAQAYNCISSGELAAAANTVYAGGIIALSDVTYDYFYRIYFGLATSCISECKITVSGDNAYVGGIIGGVREMGFNNVYFGGGVTDSYFTGECLSNVEYFGNIVGVCGAHIYESNYYVSGVNEYRNFENNYYSDNGFTAFGAVVSGNSEFVAVEDKGAESVDKEDIKNSEVYKNILSAVNGIKEN